MAEEDSYSICKGIHIIWRWLKKTEYGFNPRIIPDKRDAMKIIRIIVHLSTSHTNEVEEWFKHYFSMKIKFHRRFSLKMDKMTNNEFYNRINPKISILAWSKKSNFISKGGLFLKMIAKCSEWSQKLLLRVK